MKSPVGMPARALKNALTDRATRETGDPSHCVNCLTGCPKKDIPFCLAEALNATSRGDAENGILFCDGDSGRATPPMPDTVAGVFEALC
jgi:NAD(P)H-dependent flavin oxidoreductase YrpB (nitropropane dioxygenase family)